MFNARQIQILLLLWNKDYSGEYLAKKVHSSRRTIIRDINQLNQVLNSKRIAQIDSSGKYHLIIQNYAQFQALIDEFENEDRLILYNLLINNSLSINDLMEKTLLSKNNLINDIERINQRYQKILLITTKISKGYQLVLKFGTKIDLLAYLISLSNKVKDNRLFKDKVPEHLKKYLTDKQMNSQLIALQKISPSQIAEFYQQKDDLIKNINAINISKSIKTVFSEYAIKLPILDLADKLIAHLRRYNLFPTFTSDLFYKQMIDLKMKEPFAFDMAYDLKQSIKNSIPDILINTDYLALYIINYLKTETSIKKVQVLMLTHQHSIAYINQNIILEKIKNIQLTNVFNQNDFIQKKDNYDISIINNNNGKTDLHPDLLINGLINDTYLNHLKKLVGNNYIIKNFAQIFPKDNYLYFNNDSSDYLKVVQEVFEQLKYRGLITNDVATKLLIREQAGNQLLINHIALPHTVSNINNSKLFSVKLKHKLILNDEDIYFLIIVIINDKNDDYKPIFNYLYKVLNHKPIELIKNLTSYDRVIKFLSQ